MAAELPRHAFDAKERVVSSELGHRTAERDSSLPVDVQERLERSVNGLRRAAPDMSAHTVLSRGQRLVGAAVLALLVAALVYSPQGALRA